MIPNRKMPADERLMDRECEYVLELRTEPICEVGYDGEHTVIRCKSIASAVLNEVGNVSCL